jgi:NAD(P)-dependent dehydrogenase (short-subunit alcohol dehydrogenase family)
VIGGARSGISQRSLDCFAAPLKAGVAAMPVEDTKIAIVTGAAKRVGRAIAEALIADGWKVVAHVHHDADDEPEGALKVVADLSDSSCAATIMDACPARPSLLVNNAARFAWDGPGEFSAAEFDAHMAVNLRAPVLLSEAFAAQQSAGADSLVVNLLDAKLAALNADYLSYTLSKSGLAAWTELAARAYAARGVRVNAIAPALMLRSPGQSDDNYARMHAHNPLGRGVEVGDIIAALRFLIAAKTTSGQVLTVDSGQRFMGLARDVQFLA